MSSVITQNRNTPSAAKMAPHRSWWQQITQGFCFLLLAIVLLEGYFRLAGVGGGQFLQPDLQLGTVHVPGKQVIWRMEGFSNNKMSSVGLRDTEHKINKTPSTYRIALLGDSVVEALQVDLNDTFCKVLEGLLNDSLKNSPKNDKIKNYEVINFGCAGYSTGQEVLQYERDAVKYRPDAIVLLYNRGDSMESVVTRKDRKRTEPRPYFYIDSTGQLQEDDSVLAANFDKLKPNPAMNFLRKYSTIYGVLSQADFSLTLNEPRYRKIKEWMASGISRVNGMRAQRPPGILVMPGGLAAAVLPIRPYTSSGNIASNGLGKLRPYGNNVSSLSVGVDGIDPRTRADAIRPYTSSGNVASNGLGKLRPYGNNVSSPSVGVDAIDPRTRADYISPYNTNEMASIQKVSYPDQDEMKVTKALIGKLANQAAKNGQTFILVIYPNLTHYAALTEQAKELKIMAAQNHFLYLDLTPSFLADPQPRSNFALYHFNKKGHLTVANQLFQLFKSSL